MTASSEVPGPGGRDGRRRPGMMDVAKAAGVSHQTVSRVLNGHNSVRPETRQRVLDAIAVLGYRRNSAARALVTRRSGTIGVLTTASNLFGPVSTLIAVEEAARECGFYVSVASLRSGQAPTDAVGHFMDQNVEAIVVIAPQRHVAEAVKNIATTRAPVVMVSASAEAEVTGFHVTAVDQVTGGRLATRHLIDLGHRRIAHVTGPVDWFDSTTREEGFRAELAEAGLAPAGVLAGDWTPESGFAAGRRLVADGVPDAVFVANDLMALGLVSALTSAGVRVPQDVSVVGFDDIEGTAFYAPPLTTVRQRFADLGRQCVRLVRSALAGAVDDPAPIAPELVVRESAAARTA